MPTLARQVELTPYRRHFSKAWTSARRALRTVSGLGAGIVGAILGSLPGMAIGGIVGLVRRASLPQAPDAEPERPELLFTAVILPLIGSAALMAFYIFVFNPWVAGVLG